MHKCGNFHVHCASQSIRFHTDIIFQTITEQQTCCLYIFIGDNNNNNTHVDRSCRMKICNLAEGIYIKH